MPIQSVGCSWGNIHWVTADLHNAVAIVGIQKSYVTEIGFGYPSFILSYQHVYIQLQCAEHSAQ